MKNIAPLALALLVTLPLRGAEEPAYKSEIKSMTEVFTSKVVKVYSFQDDNYEHLSYVVTWKDHEVVVGPTSLDGKADKYKVGDTVRCRMEQRRSLMEGPATPGRMVFSLLSASGTTYENNIQRLQSVADEVARRRALREATGASMELPKTP